MGRDASPEVSIIGFGAVGKALHILVPDILPNARVRVFDRPEVAGKIEPSVIVAEMQPDAALDANFVFFCSSNRHFVDTLKHTGYARDHAVIVSVARSTAQDLAVLSDLDLADRACLLTDCGVEPGLADALIEDCVRFFDSDISVDIKCGGYVRPRPSNLLGYRSLFGTAYLPLSERQAYLVRNGRLETVPRFSGLQQFTTDQGDTLEAFHDGMTSHLRTAETNRKFARISQKTLRWRGYVDAMRQLNLLGLLDEAHDEQLGSSPKKVFERLTAKAFKMLPSEASTTVLSMSAAGRKSGDMKTKQYDIKFRDYGPLNSMMIATALPPLFCATRLREADQTGLINPADFLADNLDAFFTMAQQYGAEVSHIFSKGRPALAHEKLKE